MFRLEKLRILLVCLLQATEKGSYGQIKPSNAVAEVGGEAIFNCSGTSFLPNWFMSKDGTATNQLPIAGSCAVNINLQNHYKTEPIGGATSCNLVVFDVTMEQAGAYWCTDASNSYALLTVIDFPGNISITSSVSAEYNCVYKQESLTCTADANPPVQYEWLDLNINTVTSGSVKSITTGGRYQCTAYNDIRNQRHNETKTANETNCSWKTSTTSSVSTSAFPVTATTTSGSTHNNIVAIVMGVLFGISFAVNLTILIIWLCKYFRANKDKDIVPGPEMRYEEIRRPAEANIQQANYEELRLTPPLYVNQLPKHQN